MKVVDGARMPLLSGVETTVLNTWWHQVRLTTVSELWNGDMPYFAKLWRSTWRTSTWTTSMDFDRPWPMWSHRRMPSRPSPGSVRRSGFLDFNPMHPDNCPRRAWIRRTLMAVTTLRRCFIVELQPNQHLHRQTLTASCREHSWGNMRAPINLWSQANFATIGATLVRVNLVKIRWLGPARVVMREAKEDGTPTLYWLAHNTQLIRCAPHHVRPDFRAAETYIGDIREAMKEVTKLKSRGVTRYLDLRAANKRHIDDVDTDEEADGEIDDPDMAPSLTTRRFNRRRLGEIEMSEEDERYTPSIAPTSDMDTGEPTQRDGEVVTVDPTPTTTPEEVEVDLGEIFTPEEPAMPTIPEHAPIEVDEEEPAQEPTAPASAAPTSPAPSGDPDPEVQELLQLYEPAQAENFESRRSRLERQETFSFGPSRRSRHGTMSSSSTSGPYSHPAKTSEEIEDVVNYNFYLTDIDTSQLPEGWGFDEFGYFQLTENVKDFWEVKAGCLIFAITSRHVGECSSCRTWRMCRWTQNYLMQCVWRWWDSLMEPNTWRPTMASWTLQRTSHGSASPCTRSQDLHDVRCACIAARQLRRSQESTKRRSRKCRRRSTRTTSARRSCRYMIVHCSRKPRRRSYSLFSRMRFGSSRRWRTRCRNGRLRPECCSNGRRTLTAALERKHVSSCVDMPMWMHYKVDYRRAHLPHQDWPAAFWWASQRVLAGICGLQTSLRRPCRVCRKRGSSGWSCPLTHWPFLGPRKTRGCCCWSLAMDSLTRRDGGILRRFVDFENLDSSNTLSTLAVSWSMRMKTRLVVWIRNMPFLVSTGYVAWSVSMWMTCLVQGLLHHRRISSWSPSSRRSSTLENGSKDPSWNTVAPASTRTESQLPWITPSTCARSSRYLHRETLDLMLNFYLIRSRNYVVSWARCNGPRFRVPHTCSAVFRCWLRLAARALSSHCWMPTSFWSSPRRTRTLDYVTDTSARFRICSWWPWLTHHLHLVVMDLRREATSSCLWTRTHSRLKRATTTFGTGGASSCQGWLGAVCRQRHKLQDRPAMLWSFAVDSGSIWSSPLSPFEIYLVPRALWNQCWSQMRRHCMTRTIESRSPHRWQTKGRLWRSELSRSSLRRWMDAWSGCLRNGNLPTGSPRRAHDSCWQTGCVTVASSLSGTPTTQLPRRRPSRVGTSTRASTPWLGQIVTCQSSRRPTWSLMRSLRRIPVAMPMWPIATCPSTTRTWFDPRWVEESKKCRKWHMSLPKWARLRMTKRLTSLRWTAAYVCDTMHCGLFLVSFSTWFVASSLCCSMASSQRLRQRWNWWHEMMISVRPLMSFLWSRSARTLATGTSWPWWSLLLVLAQHLDIC